MKITRSDLPTMPAGPSDQFDGNVYIDVVSTPTEQSKVMAGIVHFTPGARTAWHTHPKGQTIHVTEGISLVQREGGAVEVARAGDTIYIEPGENHWHGASPTRFTVQLAYQEADETGTHTTWGRKIMDAEYEG